MKPPRLSKVLARAVDGAVGVFSPGAALARARDRAQTDAINAMAGSYEAARRNRLNRDWIPTLGSADTDILYDLDKLRADSRDLVRNDGYAQVVQVLVDHVVGCGLLPHAAIDGESLGLDEEVTEQLQDEIDAAFYVWTDGAEFGQLFDFNGLQQLAYKGNTEDGEAFVQQLRLTPEEMSAAGAPYSLAYALIDPDRVLSPTRRIIDTATRGTGNTIKHGIEFDSRGRRLRYWVLKKHPAEHRGGYSIDDFYQVPANEMLHLFRPLRVGQTRGVPYLAPEMDTFRKLDRLFEAELVTALVLACHSIFIRKPAPLEGDDTLSTQSDGQRVQQLEPGTITYLNPGEEPHDFNPNRPGNMFAPFVEILLRKMSTGMNVPYEFLAKDFTKTTFSGGRQSALLAQKFFDAEQARVIRQLCHPIRREVLREAVLRGAVNLPFELTPARAVQVFKASWAGPGYGYVDPEIEVGASRDAISAGLSSLAAEVARTGKNWREVLAQLAREKKYAERKGLDLSIFRPEPGSPVTSSGQNKPASPPREPGSSSSDRPRDSRALRAV